MRKSDPEIIDKSQEAISEARVKAELYVAWARAEREAFEAQLLCNRIKRFWRGVVVPAFRRLSGFNIAIFHNLTCGKVEIEL